MSVAKFSVSFDGPLAAAVRKAAAEEGVGISTWLADAAAAKARQVELLDALEDFAKEHGAVDAEEIDAVIRQARSRSIVTVQKRRPKKARRRR